MGTHDGDISLDLPLPVGQVSVGRKGVAPLHRVDDGHVAEEHDEDRHEEAEDEDGDDVRPVDGRVAGFGPVDLTSTVPPICRAAVVRGSAGSGFGSEPGSYLCSCPSLTAALQTRTQP